MERKVLDIKLWDNVRNEDLRRESGMEDAASKARTLKRRWGRHVARVIQERWAHATTIWDPNKEKEVEDVHDTDGHKNSRTQWGAQWTRLTRNRAKWKQIISELNS
jgi:hypothetical protein